MAGTLRSSRGSRCSCRRARSVVLWRSVIAVLLLFRSLFYWKTAKKTRLAQHGRFLTKFSSDFSCPTRSFNPGQNRLAANHSPGPLLQMRLEKVRPQPVALVIQVQSLLGEKFRARRAASDKN